MSISLYIAIGIIVIIIAYMIIQQILNKRAVNELDQNEFHKGLRKAQVIDVREKVEAKILIIIWQWTKRY